MGGLVFEFDWENTSARGPFFSDVKYKRGFGIDDRARYFRVYESWAWLAGGGTTAVEWFTLHWSHGAQ